MNKNDSVKEKKIYISKKLKQKISLKEVIEKGSKINLLRSDNILKI
jgi:hypothetical protein